MVVTFGSRSDKWQRPCFRNVKENKQNKRGEDFRLDVAVWLQPRLQQTESKGLNPTHCHIP